MLHKIGDLLLDYSVLLPRNIEIDLTVSKESDFDRDYVYGIIVAAIPINEDDLFFITNKEQFYDKISYTVQWADYEHPIPRYSARQIERFKETVSLIEKESNQNEKDSKKLKNSKTTKKGSKSKTQHV